MAQKSAVTAIKDEDRVSNRTNVLARKWWWQQRNRWKRKLLWPWSDKNTHTMTRQWHDPVSRLAHCIVFLRVCVCDDRGRRRQKRREGARMWDMDPSFRNGQCEIELAQHNYQWKEKKDHPSNRPCLKNMQKSSPFNCTPSIAICAFLPVKCLLLCCSCCFLLSSIIKLAHLAWPCALGRRWSPFASHPIHPPLRQFTSSPIRFRQGCLAILYLVSSSALCSRLFVNSPWHVMPFPPATHTIPFSEYSCTSRLSSA